MTVRYLLVDVDAAGSFGAQPWHDIRELVGPEGPTRVALAPQLGMAGWVNDVGHLFPDRYPRNVVGSVLLGCLGASQLPYAGPVVVTGWDPSATWRDEPEYRSLVPGQADPMAVLLADIRKVLGLDAGRPSTTNQSWMADVLAFAEHVRTVPPPTLTLVSLDELLGMRPKGGA